MSDETEIDAKGYSELECLVAGYLSTRPPHDVEHPTLRLPTARRVLEIIGEWEPMDSMAPGDCGPSAAAEIGELAQFIMDEVPGEPSQSEGAGTTAIRIISGLRARVAELEAERDAVLGVAGEERPIADGVLRLTSALAEALGVAVEMQVQRDDWKQEAANALAERAEAQTTADYWHGVAADHARVCDERLAEVRGLRAQLDTALGLIDRLDREWATGFSAEDLAQVRAVLSGPVEAP
jgi:hypothetical protein